MLKTILLSIQKFFGFAQQVDENKSKKIDLMEPKYIQKGINQEAELANELKKNKIKWAKQAKKKKKRTDRRVKRRD